MLNRIQVRTKEIQSIGSGSTARLSSQVVLPFSDTRAKHCAAILRLRDGDELKLGIVNVGICDNAAVRWVWPEGYEGGWDDMESVGADGHPKTKTRNKPGKGKQQRTNPVSLELTFNADESREVERPRVDLMLALPRPLQLQRMLPMIAQLGVGTLILTNAYKVEADYWGCHLLRQPDAVDDLLLEGLAQSGDVHLPRVVLAKRIQAFLEDDLDEVLPPEASLRVVAHPYPVQTPNTTLFPARLSQLGSPDVSTSSPQSPPPRILVAVGPEGGWDEGGHELGLLAGKGFNVVDLGPRILRSDVAANSLLALAHEQIRSWEQPEKQHTHS